MSSASIVKHWWPRKEKGDSAEEQGTEAKWGPVPTAVFMSSKKGVNLTTLSCKSKQLRKA